MPKQQLTDWFPGEVKPVRSGVYEVDIKFNEDDDDTVWYRWFSVSSGLWYAEASNNPRFAKITSNEGCGYAIFFESLPRWRGLRAQS